MYMGYSRPNSAATVFSAASIAALFSGLEKSTNGSFEKSGFASFTSAVAMIAPCLLPQTFSVAPLRGQFACGVREDLGVQVHIGSRRGRAHQRHVVKRCEQHAPIESVQVQETLQCKIRCRSRLSAIGRRPSI